MPTSSLVVVFDTSVLIPLLIPASLSTRLLRQIDQCGGKVAISPQILQELSRTLRTDQRLRQWLGTSDETIDAFLHWLPKKCLQLKGVRQVHGAVPADPDDDKIIAAAVEARASHIVTEDRHLLDLNEWQGIRIVTRTQFMQDLQYSSAA